MLVCIAVWLSVAARSVEGKAIAIALPIGAFVALGFEHCIANFYLLPIGMLSGAQVTLADFLANMGVVTLGNMLGGILISSIWCVTYLGSNQLQNAEEDSYREQTNTEANLVGRGQQHRGGAKPLARGWVRKRGNGSPQSAFPNAEPPQAILQPPGSVRTPEPFAQAR
jgi:hypothetical protein